MSNKIKELRKARRMTQINLSTRLAVSQETISAYESGKYDPSVYTLKKMSKVLNASTDYILGLTSNPSASGNEPLNSNEQLLIQQYRMLPEQQKNRLLSFSKTLLEK